MSRVVSRVGGKKHKKAMKQILKCVKESNEN
jgi:hypothetical protein